MRINLKCSNNTLKSVGFKWVTLYVDHESLDNGNEFDELKNNERENNQCDYCDKLFSEKGELKIHIKNDHPEEFEELKNHKCDRCGKTFLRKGGFSVARSALLIIGRLV